MERTAHPAHNQEGRKDVFDETPSQSQPLGGNYPSLERVVMLSLLEIMDSVKVIASHPEELDDRDLPVLAAMSLALRKVADSVVV